MLCEFTATINPFKISKGGACVVFPYDVWQAFGKGRAAVQATFGGEPYDEDVRA